MKHNSIIIIWDEVIAPTANRLLRGLGDKVLSLMEYCVKAMLPLQGSDVVMIGLFHLAILHVVSPYAFATTISYKAYVVYQALISIYLIIGVALYFAKRILVERKKAQQAN